MATFTPRSVSRGGQGSSERQPGGSTAQRPDPPANAGFTLLEVIVATAIMAIAVIGLLSLITGSLANASRVKEYDRAAMLARDKMGELLVSEPLPLGADLAGNFDAAAGWTARAEPFELPIHPTPGQPMLVRIHLEIWWQSEGRRKTAEFESYRRILIRPEQGI